jgi:hypothetical protein
MTIPAKSIFNNSKTAIKSVLFSYSQVFFSNNLWFAGILLCVSFLDVWGGLAGLLAVVLTNIIAFMIGFNRSYIKNGYYGFNALLVGLGIGVYFAPSIEFYIVLFIAVLLTLFFTVTIDGMMSKFGLPYLSVPFIFAIWIVTLATRQFDHLEISQRGVFLYNELYALGGQKFLDIYHWFGNLPVHDSLLTYFRSLGAIFFPKLGIRRRDDCHWIAILFPNRFFVVAGELLHRIFFLFLYWSRYYATKSWICGF